MTRAPSPVASTMPADEDSHGMCFKQGRHAYTPRRQEDGRIVITEPPGGVVDRRRPVPHGGAANVRATGDMVSGRRRPGLRGSGRK